MESKRIVPLSEYHRLPQETLSAEVYKRLLEVVCNNATLAIFIMDERQQCVYMNPAAELLTGFTLAETKGRILHDVIHHTRPDGRPYPLCECAIDQAFPQNNQEQGEEVFVHKDGHFYPVAYTASPIREGDHTIGTIIEVRDITQEKLDEQARQELDRAKTEFFSNISHEFRTPLTLMLGAVEDALTDQNAPLPPRQWQRLQMIQRNGLRLLKLVNTLLDFSQVEANRMQALYQPTDLAELTIDLSSLFESAVAQAGLNFTIDCPPLPQLVCVDREMWEKIVLNLLSNAFKFTFTGGITVRLRSLGDQVELRVEDTGVGIPEAELPYLFQRFHRISGTPSRTDEGSGIGLALVQELVKLHEGTIEVITQVAQGTTFIVTLPVNRTASSVNPNVNPLSKKTDKRVISFVEEALSWLQEETPTAILNGIDPTVTPADGSVCSARILVADDNADLRNYLKRLLSHQYQVDVVTDGLAALAAIRQNPPDLVISDVMMPELDGFELLRSLRSEPQTQALPMILLSARAGEEAQIAGLEAGADDYLIKPFSARELLARVEATLKLSRLRQEALCQEQKLRAETEAAHRQITQILENMGDAFIALDRDWKITYLNAEAERINQKPRLESLGKTHWEEWSASVGTNVEYQYRRAMTEKIPVHFEHHYYIPPDYNLWLEIHAYPSEEGLGIFYRDITERKRSEANLRRSEQRFRVAQELSLDAFTVLESVRDQGGNLIDFEWTYVNPKAAEILKHSPEELLGQRLLEVLPGNKANSELFERYIRVVETGEPHDIELHYNDNGISGWFRNMAVKLEDGIAISFSDITERKQTEKALQESERRFRRLVESNMFGVAFGEFTGGINYANDYFLNMIGYSHEEIKSRKVGWIDLTPPEFLPLDEAAMEELKIKGVSTPFEKEYIRKEGNRVPILIGAALLQEPYDQQQEIIAFYLDLTARKQAEAERTRLLQQEQAAREAAESANRIKDEFLAVLSHELRSPLNPILGWSRLLQSKTLDAKTTQQALETIERNARLQVELIEDLLDVSRILRGKLSLNISDVDLIPVIEAAKETVQLAAEAKSITIETQLEPNLGWVMGDASRLQQVIWNLVSNAVKFTPHGGEVKIQLKRVDSMAQITIRDNGKGISPEFLPYVFEYFRQENSSTTRKFGGLGLGLAIVRHLVELHGGTVQADSPGEELGATFTVCLPLLVTQRKVHSNYEPTIPSSDLSGIKILIVDDDEDTREFVRFLLEQEGAIVGVAHSAVEALKRLTEFQADVLLSDIGMPDMDGYQFMRQVRTLPVEQGGAIPAIALTAYAGEIDYQQAMSAGFQRHLPKPVDPDKLVGAIVSLTDKIH